MTFTFSPQGLITSDSTVIASGITRTIRQINSDTRIGFTTNSRTINSNCRVVITTPQSITSSAQILVNPVHLQIFTSADLINEIGTTANPIIFVSANAGQTTLHPSNPFLLYNDKDGSLDSTDAKSITLEVLEQQIVNELVGISNGGLSQIFTVAFSPIIQNDNENSVTVMVGSVIWTEVQSFVGYGNTDKVFIVNYTAGTITFGNGVNGMIPPNGQNIFVTYSPDTTTYGVEARDEGWLGVQSTDVVRNNQTLSLSLETATDSTHVQLSHTPLVSVGAITGIWLITDTHRFGTNYFTGGSYNALSGLVTLGTALPGGTIQVLVDYSYTISDDAESGFTQLGLHVQHTFTNPIPSKNAKKLNFQVVIPSGTSPTNGVKVKFRLRITYAEA